MSDYRDSIHCRIDPEQVWRPEGERPVQEISVIMTDDHRFDDRRSQLATAGDLHADPRRSARVRVRAAHLRRPGRTDRSAAMTVKPPAPPPLPDELERLLHRLRLPYVRRAAPEVIATATSQRWEHAEVLKVLLAEEAAGRDQATIRTRRRASNLPAGKTFDAWEPERSVIPAQTQQALRTLEWIDRHEVLCVCGPSGTGKSHLIEALGHQAIDTGRTVAWHTLETLAQLLRRHRVDDSINKAIGKVIHVDLVVVDDVGLLPISADAAEALFRVVDAAYEKRSIAISSNIHPSKAHRFE
jgi:DNA replication protein DnaC